MSTPDPFVPDLPGGRRRRRRRILVRISLGPEADELWERYLGTKPKPLTT